MLIICTSFIAVMCGNASNNSTMIAHLVKVKHLELADPTADLDSDHCRWENGSVYNPPRRTSFSHENILPSSQVRNPMIGRILVGNLSSHSFQIGT